MIPWGLGCFRVAGQCHGMGKEGEKGAPLPACAYFSPFGEKTPVYILHLNTFLPATTPSSAHFALLFEGVMVGLEL